LSTLKKAKKWQNSQTVSFLANSFKKGQMATLLFDDSGTDLPPITLINS